MDATSYLCPNCASPVDIDFKTRKGYCSVCFSTVTFPRQRFINDDKVQSELKPCVKCFLEKRFDDAKAHADRVLIIAYDSAPALYARAYYEAFVAPIRKSERIGEFFAQLPGIDVDTEEIEPLKQMFLATLYKLDEHEEAVLRWVGFRSERTDMCNFVDAFSPALIAKRTNLNFMTPSLAELYKEIAAYCTMPKTCYALLQALLANPDSPLKNNTFFLKEKTQRIYQDFVVPLGEIIQSMGTPELRDKFFRVYQQKQQEFLNKMGGNN